MNYWLLKTEPGEFSYDDLAKAGTETWDGVRNARAQKNLQAMRQGDLAFIYHTGREKAISGLAEVVSDPFPDPGNPVFFAVKVRALRQLARPITLKKIKASPLFAGWELVRLPRLSVVPVPPQYWQALLLLAGDEAEERQEKPDRETNINPGQ